ncbi:glycosyltransferase [Emticicia sp. W12TSBA100-4]|uniref:glycosyltransferase family 2 protein n=1 Tax=Emticicia sp. W12TSBA100-4 TaxID=3160965 RepID=UPI003306645F
MKNGLSIIITYYFGSKYIMECINSIYKSYDTSLSKIQMEIILVIDSPNDNSFDFNQLKNYYENKGNLKILFNEKNIGVAKSRNLGLLNSTKNHFTILDQDDFVDINYFKTIENEINNSNEDIYLLNGKYIFVNQKSAKMFYFSPKFTIKSILMQYTNIISPGLVIFNKKNIEIDNLFFETSPYYRGCDDWAAYINIILNVKNLKFKFINKVLFYYRFHENNYGNNIKGMIYSTLSVIDYFSKQQTNNSLKVLKNARSRYYFLYLLKVKKHSLLKLFQYYPMYTFEHYFTSFFNIERFNSVIAKLTKR